MLRTRVLFVEILLLKSFLNNSSSKRVIMGNNLSDLYTDYLIRSFSKTTATGLSSIVDGCLSHDQITTFLAESNLDSKNL